MNRQDVIRWAREQGLPETEVEGVFLVNADDLGRMLAMEREWCAKLVEPSADHLANPHYYLGGSEGIELLLALADAIRSRGKNVDS